MKPLQDVHTHVVNGTILVKTAIVTMAVTAIATVTVIAMTPVMIAMMKSAT